MFTDDILGLTWGLIVGTAFGVTATAFWIACAKSVTDWPLNRDGMEECKLRTGAERERYWSE